MDAKCDFRPTEIPLGLDQPPFLPVRPNVDENESSHSNYHITFVNLNNSKQIASGVYWVKIDAEPHVSRTLQGIRARTPTLNGVHVVVTGPDGSSKCPVKTARARITCTG